MQSIFRLPWCSEQLKLSEKAGLDKVRPTPVVEIPSLSSFKRKRPDGADVVSPQNVKKHQVEYVHQLPTPTSPYMNSARLPCQAETSRVSAQPSPVSTPVRGTGLRMESTAQTAGGAEISKDKLKMEAQAAKNVTSATSGGYFVPRHPSDSTANMTAQTAEVSDLTGDLTPLQQVIENEFNMQILMKHNELRLIEQELAKCQIALEQLRRCELRPYPGTSQPSLVVSEGVGPAVNPPAGFSRPTYPPPYGVTDGPYSRHYRQWLLNDPQFDSMSPQTIAQAEYLASSAGRSTRNSGHVRKSASKSLGTSTRASDPLQSIPNYPAVPAKDKSAPLVLRRSTDNNLVKLICKNCKRGNFSSIQGFLNHCRIAHKVDYKSHDMAAIDCGVVLEEGELAVLPPETHAQTAPKPTPARAVNTHAAANPSTSGRNFVHPFNSPAGLPTPTPRPAGQRPMAPAPSVASRAPQGSHNTPFKPSSHAPRLSALYAKHNVGGDLEHATAAAKQKVDLGAEEDVHSPDVSEASSPVAAFASGARMPAGTGMAGKRPDFLDSVGRPPSRKGHRQPAQRHRPSPLAPAPRGDFDSSMVSSPQDSASATFSPHTADSNPGLVSDHEDDDHGSQSDGESSTVDVAPGRPLPSVGRSCEDSMDIDVAVDDEIDQHGVIIRRNSMIAAEARGMRPGGGASHKMGGK